MFYPYPPLGPSGGGCPLQDLLAPSSERSSNPPRRASGPSWDGSARGQGSAGVPPVKGRHRPTIPPDLFARPGIPPSVSGGGAPALPLGLRHLPFGLRKAPSWLAANKAQQPTTSKLTLRKRRSSATRKASTLSASFENTPLRL